MKTLWVSRQMVWIIALSVISVASDCDVPLVDYETAFFVQNATPDTILVYVGDSEPIGAQAELPAERVETFPPIAAGEVGYLAIATDGRNLFDELPSGVLELWVIRSSDFNVIPYDSLRSDTNLFELLTFTEEELEAAGDTIVIR